MRFVLALCITLALLAILAACSNLPDKPRVPQGPKVML